MKTFNVMAEITIASTVEIKAANEDDAQIAAKQYYETQCAELSAWLYDPETDELTIEIGDADEADG